MEAKERLSRYQLMMEWVAEREIYLSELESSIDLIRGTDYSADKVDSSPMGDQIPKLIGRVEALKNEVDRLKQEALVYKCELLTQIFDMDCDVKLKWVLSLRYIHFNEYRTLKAVGRKLGYSDKYVVELHDKAIEEFSRHHTDIQPT